MNQLCFRGLKPPKPTIRTEHVARRIAERIVAWCNGDECYWETDELPDRIAEVQTEIMRVGKPATVMARLEHRQPLASCGGERVTHPYGWEFLDDNCRAVGDQIAKEELAIAVAEWSELCEV